MTIKEKPEDPEAIPGQASQQGSPEQKEGPDDSYDKIEQEETAEGAYGDM